MRNHYQIKIPQIQISSSFLNNQDDSNLYLINKYNVEIVDCFFKDESLDEYYDNFYII